MGELFGYPKVWGVELGDGRIKEKENDSGITMFSNLKGTRFNSIILDDCQAIKASIDSNDFVGDIFAVYLDVFSEDKRKQQVAALLEQVESSRATIIVGDFNSIDRGDLSGISRSIIKTAAKMASDPTFGRAIPQMMRGEITKLLKNKGFIDADSQRKATIPSKLFTLPIPFPLLRLDYAFYNDKVKKVRFEVLKGPLFDKTSDHYPILLEVQ